MTKPFDILVVSRPSYRGGTTVYTGDGVILASRLGAIDAHVFISALCASAERPLTVSYAASEADADRQYKAIFRDGACVGQAIAQRKASEEADARARQAFLALFDEMVAEREPESADIQVTVIDVVPGKCGVSSCNKCYPLQGGRREDFDGHEL